MNTNTFAAIPLAAITPSLTNPRKRFDAVKLAELAESIKASGVYYRNNGNTHIASQGVRC